VLRLAELLGWQTPELDEGDAPAAG
jgi:hypothetical protein